MKIKKCRICDTKLTTILSLGMFPAVNYYLTIEELEKKEKKYPLNFCICKNCTLGQLDEIVKAEQLFSTYHYMSSTSAPLKEHLEALGKVCRKKFHLNSKNKVLDIGCNDGTLLHYFKKFGIQTMGVDPAENILEQTKKSGIKVISDFFTKELSKKIYKNEGSFDLIVATNTLAQIIDLKDFVGGVKNLLDKNGSFVIEVGYLPEMIKRETFDSIYHEHYSYFSILSILHLFNKHGLEIYDAQKIENHGGSLRVFIKKSEYKKLRKTKRFKKLLQEEQELKLNAKENYKNFVESALRFKKGFRNLLIKLKKANATIVGVGAPAKSVILLNFSKVDHTIISYITDSTPHKQNKFMPGVHIPIMPEDKLIEDKSIDYFVLLAWTYKKAMIEKIRKLNRPGVKIIIPFPKLKVLHLS